jgi:hypothetical protein
MVMTTITIEQFYEKFIKPMPTTEKLRLVALITHKLAADLPLVETLEASQLSELDTPVRPSVDVYEHIPDLPEEAKGSPKAVLQLADTLPPEEADAILQAAQMTRRIDWDMWQQVAE